MAADQVRGVSLNESPGAASGSEQLHPWSTARATRQTAIAEASSPAQVTTRTAAAEASLPAPVTTRRASAQLAPSLQQQRARPGSRIAASVVMSWQCLDRCLGLTGRRSLQVRYPWHFKVCVAVVLIIAASWVGNYMLVVSPAIDTIDNQPCKDGGTASGNQLAYNARMLLVYFVWFAVARTSLFVPCVASRVATVQSRTHGFCRTYCVHLMIRDGPLYIFVIGSMLFWFHLMQNPYCGVRSGDSNDTNLSMYRALRLYAIYSCLVSVLCMFLAYWHNRLLRDAARRFPRQDRGAPPGTLEKLETRAYDEALFGDEDGKLYASECAICLGTWEEEDVIKVTPCGHAFHEQCLSGWFRNGRTCALCRQDLTRTQSSSGHLLNWRISFPRPRALGAPTNRAASAAATLRDETRGSPTMSANEESDDLEAAANEGPMAHDEGQDNGIHTL